MSEIMKVPILGIGNAGKTSLVKTLNNEFKQLSRLQPTKGVQRTRIKFLDREIVIWDFGGQEKYREGYLRKSEIYFTDVSHFYFAVDVQDRTVFDDAITYFKDLLEMLRDKSPSAQVNVLFTKVDPGIDLTEINDGIEFLKGKFNEIANGFNLKYLNTTIYNPLTVITAFSRDLIGNTIIYDFFSKSFDDFCNEKGLDFIMVMTKEMKEIGHHISYRIDPVQLRSVSQSIFESFEKNKMKITDINAENEQFFIRIIGFQAGKDPFYFIYGISHDKEEYHDDLMKEGEEIFAEVKKIMKYW